MSSLDPRLVTALVVAVILLMVFSPWLFRAIFRRNVDDEDTLPLPRAAEDYMGRLKDALHAQEYNVREDGRFLIVDTEVGRFEIGFIFDNALNHGNDCDITLFDPLDRETEFTIRATSDYGLVEDGIISAIVAAEVAA